MKSSCTTDPPFSQWRHLLQPVVDQSTLLTSLILLEETESTQDAVTQHGAALGTVVVASLQTAGRGRMQRQWIDDQAQGVACSIALAPQLPQRLAIALGVATASALEQFVAPPVSIGIKWPNDILVDGRKVAGTIVEQRDGVAVAGVGINVLQQTWPPDFDGAPVSMHQCGSTASRPQVIAALLEQLEATLLLDDKEIAHAFRKRDVLVGRYMTFCSAGRVVVGTVIDIDPMCGIEIRTDSGETEFLQAAVTTTHLPL